MESLENTVTVLGTEFKNDELNTEEHEPTQMCQLWTQRPYSLELSLGTMSKKSSDIYVAFVLYINQTDVMSQMV